jgi:hypothetical protein
MKPQRHKFRSDYELQVAKKLAEQKVPYDYEAYVISYVPKTKRYTPDFYLPDQDIYIEAKGYFSPADRTKMLLVIDQNPELDIRMLFLRASNKLSRKSNTTYGGWCDRHNILWADGFIPKEWLKEKK